MPILIRSDSFIQVVSAERFPTEEELELLLTKSPDLLREDGGPVIAFVDREVDLDQAGRLDLLFVNSEGLPIAVETKLACNPQARREVVAQAVDYLSSLTLLTVDELDQRVDGKLESALRSLVPEGQDADFGRLWTAVGTQLRAGQSRLVVVLDDAPAPLERIFRFLARNSKLDVQLLTIQRYTSSKFGEVFVPRTVVRPASEDANMAGPKEPHPELAAAVQLYNDAAPPDLRATGNAPNVRQIRAGQWNKAAVHYEFYRTRNYIGAELHIETDAGRPLSTLLSAFAGKTVARGQGTLVWDANWMAGRGRLCAQFPLATSAETVAQAMRDLISITGSTVTEKKEAITAKQASA